MRVHVVLRTPILIPHEWEGHAEEIWLLLLALLRLLRLERRLSVVPVFVSATPRLRWALKVWHASTHHILHALNALGTNACHAPAKPSNPLTNVPQNRRCILLQPLLHPICRVCVVSRLERHVTLLLLSVVAWWIKVVLFVFVFGRFGSPLRMPGSTRPCVSL